MYSSEQWLRLLHMVQTIPASPFGNLVNVSNPAILNAISEISIMERHVIRRCFNVNYRITGYYAAYLYFLILQSDWWILSELHHRQLCFQSWNLHPVPVELIPTSNDYWRPPDWRTNLPSDLTVADGFAISNLQLFNVAFHFELT